MASVITGEGLGLYNSSLNLLGSASGNPQLGQNGNRVYVNSQTGNLIIQQQDEFLTNSGLDLSLVRTYNSQGQFDDDNADNWRLNAYRRLHSLSGTVNTAGSSITKTFGDGFESVYYYDETLGLYVSTDGEGAHDALGYDAATASWGWIDGTVGYAEIYTADGNGGWRIASTTNNDGSSTNYIYSGDLLSAIQDASGQITYLDYIGNNLSQIRVVSAGQTSISTHYGYDPQGRLQTVTLDLSPENADISDGNVFTTTYTYDGSSTRVASVSHSDGTSISFSYDAQGRVKTYTDGAGLITTLNYSGGSQDITLNADTSKLSSGGAALPAVPDITLPGSYIDDGTAQHVFSIEAENYDTNIAQGGNAWVETYPAGYSGSAALTTATNTGVSNNTGYVTNSPQLDYKLNFTQTGTYYVWIRGSGASGLDDSIHVGLNGQAIASSDRIGSFPAGLNWINNTMDGVVATIDVTQLGEQTLNVWMREDGFVFDKIVLTTDSAYVPALSAGTGPVASARAGGTTQPGAPAFYQPPGHYQSAPLDVALAVPDNAVTYYTLDGSDPTQQSLLYSGSFTITADTVVKARSFRSLGGTTISSDIATGSYTFVQTGEASAYLADGTNANLISIEAENYDANLSRSGISWVDTFPTDYSGSGALTTDINPGTNINTNYAGTSPQLDYLVNFTQTGTYYIWVRGSGATASDDSLHVGLNGQQAPGGYRISGFNTGLGWSGRTMDGVFATIDVTQTGVQTLNVWMREDGFVFDKIVLTMDDSYNPYAAGLAGPAESTRTPLTPLPPAGGAQTYTVQTSDSSWDDIASVVYGDAAAGGALQAYFAGLNINSFTTGDQLAVPLSLTYSIAGATNQVDVIDPLNNTTTYIYDSQNRLAEIQSPDIGGSRLSTVYGYDAQDNLQSVTDGKGNVTNFIYNLNGTLAAQQDAAGRLVEYTYNIGNLLENTIVYLDADTDGAGPDTVGLPTVSRNAYDNEGHLRFSVSAEGRVTEYRYNADGLRIATIVYTGGLYDISTLAIDAALFTATSVTDPDDIDLLYWNGSSYVSWVAAQDLTQTQRVDYAYDFRGNLAQTTTYAAVDATGNGIDNASQPAAITLFVYDQYGQLRETIDPRGSQTATANDYKNVTDYDGLGRVTSTQVYDENGALITSIYVPGYTTITTYDDASNSITTTITNGLSTTSSFDARGLLTAQTPIAPDATPLGDTTYHYDANGRLRYTQDALGNRVHSIYDEAGRVVATVDQSGALVETIYDAAGNVFSQIAYANKLTSTQLALLNTDAAPNIAATVDLSLLRPPADSTADRQTYSLYDASNREIFSIVPTDDVTSGAGYVTQVFYDGAGRVTDVVAYNESVANIGSLNINSTPADITITNNSAEDRYLRNFYSDDNLLLASVDGEGYVTENFYDAAGQLTKSIVYAQSAGGSFITDDLATIQANLGGGSAANRFADANNRTSYYFYNARGQQTGVIDRDGYLTTTQYDLAGNISETKTYNVQVNYIEGGNLAQHIPADTSPAQWIASVYDAQNRLISESRYARNAESSNVNGTQITTTSYLYDEVGNLIKTTLGVNSTDVRTLHTQYDKAGRVIAELSARGAEALDNPGTRTVQQIWDQYAIYHKYNELGQRIQTSGQNGQDRWFYYDEAGRQKLTITASDNGSDIVDQGSVILTNYNSFGQVVDTTTLANRINTSTLSGGAYSDIDVVLQSLLSADDSTSPINYTVRGLVREALDANGYRTQQYYNAFGEVSATFTENAQTPAAAPVILDTTNSILTETIYDQRGLATTVIEDRFGLERQTDNVFDAFGRVTHVYLDGVLQQRVEYNDNAGREAVTTYDALGFTTVLRYDAFDRVLTSQDKNGGIYVYEYDDENQTISITSPQGITTKTHNNQHGETVVVTDGNDVETHYVYDKDGNLTDTIFDPLAVNPNGLNITTTQSFDESGRIILTRDANGTPTVFKYDAANRVIESIVDPQTYTDEAGALVSNASGLNLRTTNSYDAKGQLIVRTDSDGTVTETHYDKNGQVTDVIVDPLFLNLQTHYDYDSLGRTVTVIEANNSSDARETKYVYDNLNRRIEAIIDPNGLALSTRYYYDSFDNTVAVVDAEGKVTRFIFDANQRQTHVIDAENGLSVSEYADNGNLAKLTRYTSAVTISSTADPYQLTLADLTINAAANDQTTYYVYDKDDRVRFTIDGLGQVVENTYTTNGQVIDSITHTTPINVAALAALGIPVTEQNVFALLSQVSAQNGAWQPTLTLSASSGVSANPSKVVTTAGGAKHSLWLQTNPSSGSRDLYTSAYDIQNGWGAGTLLASTINDITDWYTYEFASGEIYVTYHQMNGSADELYVMRYSDAAGWEDLGLVDNHYYNESKPPKLFKDVAGNLFAYFFRASPYPGNYHIMHYIEGSGWQNTAQPDFTSTIRNVLDIDKGIFYLSDAGSYTVRQYSLANGWQDIAPAQTQAASFSNVDDNGIITLVNSRAVFDGFTYLYTEFTSEQYIPGSGWSGPQLIANIPVSTSTYVQDEQGNGLLAWADTNIDNRINTMYYDVDSGWGSVQTIDDIAGSTSAANLSFTQFKFDSNGNIVAFWSQQDASFTPNLYTARYNVAQSTWSTPELVTTQVSYYSYRVAIDDYDNISVSSSVYNVDHYEQVIRDYRIDPQAGVTDKQAYDNAGRLRYQINAEGAVSEYRYDASGNIVETVEHLNRIDNTAIQATDQSVRIQEIQAEQARVNALNPPAGRDRISYAVYDAANRLTLNVNALGYVVENIYDQRGNVVLQKRHAEQIDTSVLTDITSRAQQIGAQLSDDSNDQLYRNVFDAANRDVFNIDAAGYVIKNEYNERGQIIKTTEYAQQIDTSGLADNATLNDIDAALAARTGVNAALDHITSLTYDDAGRQLTHSQLLAGTNITDSYAYDKVGNQIRHTNGNGDSEYFAYDAQGRVVRSVDFGGYLITSQYDALGNLQQTLTYMNAAGLPGSVQDDWAYTLTLPAADSDPVSGDRLSQYEYDKLGRLVKQTAPSIAGAAGVETHYGYDVFGNQTSVTEAFGLPEQRLTTRVYDNIGQLLEETIGDGSAEAATTQYKYDGFGNRVAEIDARGVALYREQGGTDQTILDAHTTTTVYDKLNRVITIDDTIGQLDNTYDAFGNTVKVTDANHNTSYSYYNNKNQVTLQVNQEGYATAIEYDAFGNITKTIKYYNQLSAGYDELTPPTIVTTPGKDQTLVDEYDTLNRKIKTIDALGYVERFIYDNTSNVIEFVDKNNNTIEYVYDALGRQIIEQTPFLRRTEPVDLTAYTNNALNFEIVTNDVGGMLALWDYSSQGTTVLAASYYDSATGWSAPQQIGTVAYPYSAVLHDDGTAAVAWVEFGNLYASNFIGGSWTPRTALEGLSAGVQNVQVAADNSGKVFALWEQNDGSSQSIYAATYTSAGGWSSATLIESLTEHSTTPKLSVAADGGAAVVWEQRVGSQYSVVVNRYTTAGGWQGAQTISTSNSTSQIDKKEIIVSDGGNVTVLWVGNNSLLSRYYDVTSGWQPVTALEGTAVAVTDLHVTRDSNGVVHALWKQGIDFYSAFSSNGQNWSSAEKNAFISSSVYSDEIQLINGANGDVYLVYGNAKGFYVQTFDLQRGWHAPQLLENRTVFHSGLAAAFNETTNELVLNWHRGGSTAAPVQVQHYAVDVQNRYDHDAVGNLKQSIEAYGLAEQRQTDFIYDKENRKVSTTHPNVLTSVDIAPLSQANLPAYKNSTVHIDLTWEERFELVGSPRLGYTKQNVRYATIADISLTNPIIGYDNVPTKLVWRAWDNYSPGTTETPTLPVSGEYIVANPGSLTNLTLELPERVFNAGDLFTGPLAMAVDIYVQVDGDWEAITDTDYRMYIKWEEQVAGTPTTAAIWTSTNNATSVHDVIDLPPSLADAASAHILYKNIGIVGSDSIKTQDVAITLPGKLTFNTILNTEFEAELYDSNGEILGRIGGRTGSTFAEPITVTKIQHQQGQLQRPETQQIYDALGNLRQEIDARGNITYHYYNDLGQRIGTVDAERYYHETEYDAVGNAIRERTYADKIPAQYFTGTAVDLAAITAPDVFSFSVSLFDRNDYREVLSKYDLQNNTIESRIANILVFDRAGGERTQDLVKSAVYDANGNVLSNTNRNGDTTYNFYDRIGNQIAFLDAEGNLITRSHDANGNILSNRQLATQVERSILDTYTYDQLVAHLTSGTHFGSAYESSADRVIVYTYDNMNRKLSESLLDEQYSIVNLISGGLFDLTGNITSRYEYDGLGNTTALINPENVRTDYAYDNNNRLIYEKSVGVNDYQGYTVSSVKQYTYNAQGLVIAETQQGTGSETDQVTRHTYDEFGRRVESIDALGGYLRNYYDLNGNVILTSQRKTNADGTIVSVQTPYQYDALNRQTVSTLLRPTSYDEQLQFTYHNGLEQFARYNAYGEIVAKGQNNTAIENFQYDGAGRLVYTNQGGGQVTLRYDAEGNKTAEIYPQTYVGQTPPRNEYVYNRNGQLLSRYTPRAEYVSPGDNYWQDVKNDVSQAGVFEIFREASDTVVTINRYTEPLVDRMPSQFTIDLPQLNGYGDGDIRIVWQSYEHYGPGTGTFSREWTLPYTSTTFSQNFYFLDFPDGAPDPQSYTVFIYKDVEGREVLVEQINGDYSAWDSGSVTTASSPADNNIHLKAQDPNAAFVKFSLQSENVIGPKYEYILGFPQLVYAPYTYSGTVYELQDVDGQDLQGWFKIDLISDNVGGFLADDTYSFNYTVHDAGGVELERYNGRLEYDQTPRVLEHRRFYATAGDKYRVEQYEYNAFGELDKQIDTRAYDLLSRDGDWESQTRLDILGSDPGAANLSQAQKDLLLDRYTTEFVYNKRGKLVEEIKPQSFITLENADGTITSTDQYKLTRQFSFDRLGREIGYRQANDVIAELRDPASPRHLVSRYYNQRGDLLREYNPDGSYKVYTYDVFGNRRSLQDELGNQYDYLYDKKNNLVELQRPTYTAGTRNTERYQYDELGRRIAHTNAKGYTESTFYDDAGRLHRTVSYAGVENLYEYEYDAVTQDTTTITRKADALAFYYGSNSLSAYSTQTKDYFGRIISDQSANLDNGNFSYFRYEYNARGQLTAKVRHELFGADLTATTYDYYDDGSLKSIRGLDNTISYFQYDAAGNRIEENYVRQPTAGTVVLQQSRATYDANNRVIDITDPDFSVHYDYDANGNRIHIGANYHRIADGSRDYWYKYDVTDRFTLVKGTLNTTTNKIELGQDGRTISYLDSGWRATSNNERYAYDDEGRLTHVYITNGGGQEHLRARRWYDAAGNVRKYEEYSETGLTPAENSGFRRSEYTYTADNKTQTDATTTNQTDVTLGWYFYFPDNALAHVTNRQQGAWTHTNYYYHDSRTQEISEIRISGTLRSYTPDQEWKPGLSRYTYDANNNLAMVEDVAGNRRLEYQVDQYGRIFKRAETDENNVTKSQRFYYYNGIAVGDAGDFGISQTDYAEHLAEAEARANDPGSVARSDPTANLNFDYGFSHITSGNPGTSPGSYSLQAHDLGSTPEDTLRNVARTLWGDASLWYLLADANGINAASTLTEGQNLVVPNVVTNVNNNVDTFKVYNPNELLGNTQPTLPDAPPPPQAKCNTILTIILVIIVIVVTIYTAGAAATLLSGVATTGGAVLGGSAIASIGLGYTLAAAAIGGFVGSLAGQFFGVLTGLREDISFSEAAIAGVTTAATAYLGGTTGILGDPNTFTGAVNNAIINNAISQSARIIFKKQDGFDWASFRSSLYTSIASYGINQAASAASSSSQSTPTVGRITPRGGFAYTPSTGQITRQFIQNLVTGAAAAAINKAVYHQRDIDWGGVAANAVGDTVRSYITATTPAQASATEGDISQTGGLLGRVLSYFDGSNRAATAADNPVLVALRQALERRRQLREAAQANVDDARRAQQPGVGTVLSPEYTNGYDFSNPGDRKQQVLDLSSDYLSIQISPDQGELVKTGDGLPYDIKVANQVEFFQKVFNVIFAQDDGTVVSDIEPLNQLINIRNWSLTEGFNGTAFSDGGNQTVAGYSVELVKQSIVEGAHLGPGFENLDVYDRNELRLFVLEELARVREFGPRSVLDTSSKLELAFDDVLVDVIAARESFKESGGLTRRDLYNKTLDRIALYEPDDNIFDGQIVFKLEYGRFGGKAGFTDERGFVYEGAVKLLEKKIDTTPFNQASIGDGKLFDLKIKHDGDQFKSTPSLGPVEANIVDGEITSVKFKAQELGKLFAKKVLPLYVELSGDKIALGIDKSVEFENGLKVGVDAKVGINVKNAIENVPQIQILNRLNADLNVTSRFGLNYHNPFFDGLGIETFVPRNGNVFGAPIGS